MNNSRSISERVAGARTAFRRGASRPVAWRRGQLEALERMLAAEELELCEALSSDLGKPAPEAWLTEVSFVIQASQFARKNLDRWTRSRPVNTPVFAMPGRSRVRPEPLGTVLIIAPWNYPLQLCLAPLVTAISAGNCAVIKPSELAPATASALPGCCPAISTRNAWLSSKVAWTRLRNFWMNPGDTSCSPGDRGWQRSSCQRLPGTFHP
ncbi:MAG: aldehyde dehydrogenase family protein [Gammaproteobacteria bacterium]|nr:aldehyde dehydrogenase family protein [Gammaproteobacteria bacterium]